MPLIVATILPIVDRPRWFQIKIEKKNDGSETWDCLDRGTMPFFPRSGVWHYYPQYAALVFKVHKGDPSDQSRKFATVIRGRSASFLRCRVPLNLRFGLAAQEVVRQPIVQVQLDGVPSSARLVFRQLVAPVEGFVQRLTGLVRLARAMISGLGSAAMCILSKVARATSPRDAHIHPASFVGHY